MSVGANYRAVTRSRSRAEFISKLKVVIEEADESLFWLEVLSEAELAPIAPHRALMREGNEIVSILVTSQRTARRVSNSAKF
jgi:four helix bundle protein